MMNLEMRFFSHSFLLLLPSGFSSLPTRGMFANASLPEAWISLFWLHWCSLSRQPRRGADPPRGAPRGELEVSFLFFSPAP